MTAGKAKGDDRSYQVACRDVLIARDNTLQPWTGDGIDVPFSHFDTKWHIDVALWGPCGRLVVAECRRTADSVEQGDVGQFAWQVEKLRGGLDIEVAGVFFAKSGHQLGAVKVGQNKGIELAILDENEAPPSFNLTFLRYDREREKKLRDIVLGSQLGRYEITGHDAMLKYRGN